MLARRYVLQLADSPCSQPISGTPRLRMFSRSALIAIAAALQVSAGALRAQAIENLPAKVTARRVIEAPSPSAWTDRYANMLGVGAAQGRVPVSLSDAQKKLLAMRAKVDSVRVLTAALMASRRIECPMPVAKADSGRFAEMK